MRRYLWPDRNPLRRTVDRVEAAVVAVLAVLFLVVAPLAASAAGQFAYHEGAGAARAEQAGWHQVRAVLLAKAIGAGYSGQADAPARWTDPQGVRHTGLVMARYGTRAGSTVRVWIDAAGRPTGAPMDQAQVAGQAILAAAIAALVAGLILLGAGTLAHYLLGRRRLAAWDAEWRATGPQWSRQR